MKADPAARSVALSFPPYVIALALALAIALAIAIATPAEGLPQRNVDSNELPPWSDEVSADGRGRPALGAVAGAVAGAGADETSPARERQIFDLLALRAVFDMLLAALHALRDAAAGNVERARTLST